MKKHKYILFIAISISITIYIFHFTKTDPAQTTKKMDVLSSHSTVCNNWYSENISVIVDVLTASNKYECSKSIVQTVLANNFPSIDFSFKSTGYPNELSVCVYTSMQAFSKGNSAFSFDYETIFNTTDINAQNNIKDNQDQYSIYFRE